MCIAGGSIPGVVYAGVFIAACALYPAFPGNITWLSNSRLRKLSMIIPLLTSFQILLALQSEQPAKLFRSLWEILPEVSLVHFLSK